MSSLLNRHSTVSSVDKSGSLIDDDGEDIVVEVNDDGASGFLNDSEGAFARRLCFVRLQQSVLLIREFRLLFD